ncbi:MAG: Methyltransferase type 11 [Parcubacteria group bacterium GW2011_GWC2_38_7]|nr:MAG: Methyltransferase type 11 [Parcubacteria group bacterium GW2011_GWC2_38_7]
MDEKEQPQPQTPDQGSIEVPETRPQTHEQEVPSERPKDRETHRADEQAAIEQIRSKLAEEAPKHAPQKPQEEPLQQISRTTWDKVRDTLNVWPYTIELMQRLTRRKETGAIIDFLDAQQNDKILEIGCNTGYLLQQNHEQKGVGPNYTALDQNISSAARRRAEQSGATVVEKDGTQTGYESGAFDKVVTSHVLEHFDDPALLLKEISRILSGEGIAVIAVPREKEHKSWNPMSWPSKFKGHKTHFSKPEELAHLLEESGFEVEDHWSSRKNIVIKAKKKKF